jgi:hypothetical protein
MLANKCSCVKAIDSLVLTGLRPFFRYRNTYRSNIIIASAFWIVSFYVVYGPEAEIFAPNKQPVFDCTSHALHEDVNYEMCSSVFEETQAKSG